MSRIFTRLSISLNEIIVINETETLHYLLSVLRLKKGDSVSIFNAKDGEFLAEIISINKDKCTLKTIKLLRLIFGQDYSYQNIYFGVSLIKQDRFLDCIDMLTQLGVLNFFPLQSKYTQKSYLKLGKIEKRAIGSIQQSGRMVLPYINNVLTLEKFLKIKQNNDILLCADKGGIDFNSFLRLWKTQFQANIFKMSKIFLLVGPEGGFANDEASLISSYSNTFFIKLNQCILRSETAAINLFCNISVLQDLLKGISE